MKINFAQLEVYTDIKKTNKVCIDVREQIGEMIYEVGSGIKDHALAFKIYNSDNEVELTSEEVEVLNKYIQILRKLTKSVLMLENKQVK